MAGRDVRSEAPRSENFSVLRRSFKETFMFFAYIRTHCRSALLCLLLLFFFAAPAVSDAADDGAVTALSTKGTHGLPAFLALGGRREDAALTPRGGENTSLPEQLLGGSYLGALLFGFPATGVGGADLIALAALAYFVLRTVGGRQSRKEDRFTVHRNDDWEDKQDNDTYAPRPPRPEHRQDKQSSNTDDPANPRDNVWARRLRGETPNEDSQPDRSPPSGDGPLNRQPPPRRAVTVKDRAEAMWGHLSSKEPEQASDASASAIAEGAHIPAGFDVKDFLNGARTLYVRLQSAWASRNVEDIAPFVETGLLQALRQQAAAYPQPVSVDIVLVNATLQDVGGASANQWAEVHFNVLMKTGDEAQPSEVNELWRFSRSGDSGGMWRLASIDPAD